jgi:hypothetical protein
LFLKGKKNKPGLDWASCIGRNWEGPGSVSE